MALSPTTAQNLTESVVVDFDCKVASGGYGDVYKGRLTRDVDGHSGEVAVKVTRFIFANIPEKVLKDIKQELDIWQRHQHPYILPLIGIYLYEGVPCAVSPWCDSGTIIQYMKPKRDRKVSDFDLLQIHRLELKLLSEAAAGLAHLHAYDLAHGDIKASNILVKCGVAQLGDFGFSIILAEQSPNTSSHLGTARWFAPESLEEHAHRAQEADMWAFGCVILELRTLLVPYHGVPDAAVPLAILKDRPFERPNGINPSLWSMAEACWSRSPKARIASPTLVSRMKTALKYVTLLCKVLGALPHVHSLHFGYPNSTSDSTRAGRFALASVILKREKKKSLDLTVAVATARNALRSLEARCFFFEARGKRYPRAALQPTIRLIAITSPQLAKELMIKLSSPPSRSPLRAPTCVVYFAAFLPDGHRLVSSSQDMTLSIWDIKTGETVTGPLEGHTSTVRCVSVHGSRIASCSWAGSFCVWDADTGKLVLGPITAHDEKRVRWIAYSKDGAHIATAGHDNRVALWDANVGVRLRDMVGHAGPVMCVAFSEAGTRLVSGSGDTTVRIWDVASGECIGGPLVWHTETVKSVCFSRDDKRIFSSSHDGIIRIWDVETRALIVGPLRMEYAISSMALSPDGKRLVSSSYSGKIALWDAKTGAAIAVWDATRKTDAATPTSFMDHTSTVWGVAFSPDGRMIASASLDGRIAVWDTTNEWGRYDVDDEDVEKLNDCT